MLNKIKYLIDTVQILQKYRLIFHFKQVFIHIDNNLLIQSASSKDKMPYVCKNKQINYEAKIYTPPLHNLYYFTSSKQVVSTNNGLECY